MEAGAESHSERDRLYDLALIPAGIAFNVAVAIAVSTLKLPVYLDAIGTLAVVLMARRPGLTTMWAGVFVGVSSFVVIALLHNPTIIWFAHVQAAIAVYAYCVLRSLVRRMEARPKETTGNWLRIVLAGIGLGIITAALSAPVAALLFSGITPNGPGGVVALLLASGQNLYQAVFTGGFSIEPIDKTIQVVLAVAVYMGSPRQRRSTKGTQD